jgi:hypothetical protein
LFLPNLSHIGAALSQILPHSHSNINVEAVTSDYEALEKTFICDMVSSTNIGTTSSWACNNSTIAQKCLFNGLLCSSGAIYKIEFSSVSISGTIPPSITSLTALQMIKFISTSIGGPIPANLMLLSKLKYLNMPGNLLTGTIPAVPSSLLQLTLSENYLVGAIPSSVYSATAISILQLNSNNFTGHLPSAIGSLSLTFLALNDNLFTGPLPSTIGSLSLLTYFALFDNSFTGTLPSTVGSLLRLAYLSLTGNSISGTLPPAIGSLTSLSSLYLNRNSFVGSVPDSFSSLSQLVILQLQGNSLSAVYPSALCGFTKLTKFSITQDPQCGATSTPSKYPSRAPTTVPTKDPSLSPTRAPTSPSISPSRVPSAAPTFTPSVAPTLVPSAAPTFTPSVAPTLVPSAAPTFTPSVAPTLVPSAAPTSTPSVAPTLVPSAAPTFTPSVAPTLVPSAAPTFTPSVAPTLVPSAAPTSTPSVAPTLVPSAAPTFTPSVAPTLVPSAAPTSTPSVAPTLVPSAAPTSTPSVAPTLVPSAAPTFTPSVAPTLVPSAAPTFTPSVAPTLVPSAAPSTSPELTPAISLTISATFVNPADRISISASIRTKSSTVILWSVDDQTINLASVALTPVSQAVGVGNYIFNLVIPGGALHGKSTPYSFSLSAGLAVSTISFVVNSPPQLGSLSVNPEIGTALNTKFNFLASNWIDDNLPLSYKFGYLDSSRHVIFVRDRAGINSALSLLPPGVTQSHDNLLCLLRVFDSFDAYNSWNTSVVVQVNSTVDWKSSLVPLLDSSRPQETKLIVSLVTSMLNVKNCSSAPNCATLYREDCATAPNTCGECLNGYLGESGNANSPCFDESTYQQLSQANTTQPCTTKSNCATWEICNLGGESATGFCQPSPKSCPNHCQNRGQCSFLKIASDRPTKECNIFDTSCQAVCSCDEGFYGESCLFTAEELVERRQLRMTSLNSLHQIMAEDSPTFENISSWLDILSSTTAASDELPPDSQSLIIGLSSTILSQLSQYSDQTSSDVLDSLLTSVNDAIKISSNPSLSTTRRLSALDFTEFFSFLDLYGEYQSQNIFAGQASVGSIQSQFRVASDVLSLGDSTTISTPSTPEELFSILPSDCQVSSISSSHGITLTTLNGKYYDGSENFTSAPLRVAITNVSSTESPILELTIQNSEPQSYGDYSSDVVLNTTCVIGEFSRHELYCPGGPAGNILVIHTCFGNVTEITTHCPTVRVESTCSVLGGSDFNCTVKSFDSTSTICSCQKKSSGGAARRLISTSGGNFVASGALEVVAASVVVVDQFASTMATADNLTAQSLQKAVIVLLLYGTLWSVGFFAVAIFTYNQRHSKSEPVKKAKAKSEEAGHSTSSLEQGREFLTKYVNEAFPAVFQQKPAWQRLWGEISRHHRYLLLFVPTGHSSNSLRSLTAIHLLTVQSMLMFIMALCYDLQFPQYSQSCNTHSDRASCLSEKSLFDSSQSICQWAVSTDTLVVSNSSTGGDMTCHYVEQSSQWNIHAFIVISIVVAMFTSPVNLIVDFLFHDILSAPTADSIKLQKQDTAMKRVARRVSTMGTDVANAGRRVGRRISQASVEAMAALAKDGRGRQTLNIPETTMEAHINASVTTGHLVEAIRKHNDSQRITRDRERSQSTTFKKRANLSQKRSMEKSCFESENGAPREVSTSLTDVDFSMHSRPSPKVSPDQSRASKPIEDLFGDLSVDIVEQRKLLSRSEQELFDEKWAIDPTGEFYKVQQRVGSGYRQLNAEDLIKEELLAVRTDSQNKFQKLRFAEDMHIGLELLHLFILDLLGRNSRVAKIFVTKSEQE